jgi:hypothetical protein
MFLDGELLHKALKLAVSDNTRLCTSSSPTWRYLCDQAAACTDNKRAPCNIISIAIIFGSVALGFRPK